MLALLLQTLIHSCIFGVKSFVAFLTNLFTKRTATRSHNFYSRTSTGEILYKFGPMRPKSREHILRAKMALLLHRFVMGTDTYQQSLTHGWQKMAFLTRQHKAIHLPSQRQKVRRRPKAKVRKATVRKAKQRLRRNL